MVKDVTRYNIEIFRGDTFEAELDIEGYELGEFDTLKYAVKKSTELDEEPMFEKDMDIENPKIIFEHEDTDDLEEDTYYYDVQLSIARNEAEPIIRTILYGELRIKGDVTD